VKVDIYVSRKKRKPLVRKPRSRSNVMPDERKRPMATGGEKDFIKVSLTGDNGRKGTHLGGHHKKPHLKGGPCAGCLTTRQRRAQRKRKDATTRILWGVSKRPRYKRTGSEIADSLKCNDCDGRKTKKREGKL